MPPGMPAAAEADAALEAGLRARGGFAKAGAGAVPVVDLAAPGAAEALWAAATYPSEKSLGLFRCRK